MRGELWEDLLKTALLGTERCPPPRLAAAGRAADVVARLSAAPADAAVLGAAAVISTCRRAGFVPAADGSVLSSEPCYADDLPAVGPRAERRLRAMIAGDQIELLPEWLVACTDAGRRVPEMALPGLLELARTKPEHRDALLPVLGKRGRWLAAQNPDWSYALGGGGLFGDAGDADAAWQTGDRAARLSLLSRLRCGDPAKGLALVQSTWSQEPAEDRARFIAALERGLSPADESFLEAGLDDRSKEVRRTAAGLLARLPRSQLVRRMTERAAPLLTWKAGKKPKVEVTLPPPPDKAAERDGIEAKPSGTRFGQKQWGLWQVLSAVPPSTWSKQWEARPAEILEAVRKNEFEKVLVTAWARAAARHGDAAWAEAIVATELATVMDWDGFPLAAELQALLPDSRREALLIEQLAADADSGGMGESASSVLLRAHKGAWSVKLARAVLVRVREMIRRPRGNYWQGSAMLREAALRMPPAMFDELAKGWPEKEKEWDQWKGVVDTFLSTVQARRDMLEEIRR
jgi:hypothetical protein